MAKKEEQVKVPEIIDNVDALVAKMEAMREAQREFATFTPVSYTHLQVIIFKTNNFGGTSSDVNSYDNSHGQESPLIDYGDSRHFTEACSMHLVQCLKPEAKHTAHSANE